MADKKVKETKVKKDKSKKESAPAAAEKEASIHASNVMILDPKSNEPTRIGS
ncbi:MAG: 50S ribosomal protein L24, partial [Ignavibacteriaceae bacterium]|nr:50S ribosomal protein L24 [Ignavibacteriaceae bacterium]